MEFKAEASLLEAISSDNIDGVREALIEYIIRYSGNTQEIMYAVTYAKELIDGIFEEHNENPFQDISHWNKEYFFNEVDELRNNFSEIRFQHLCLVGAHLIPKDDNKDTIIINNTEPVTDMEIQVEKLKTGVALGIGLLVGFLIGRKRNR